MEITYDPTPPELLNGPSITRTMRIIGSNDSLHLIDAIPKIGASYPRNGFERFKLQPWRATKDKDGVWIFPVRHVRRCKPTAFRRVFL